MPRQDPVQPETTSQPKQSGGQPAGWTIPPPPSATAPPGSRRNHRLTRSPCADAPRPPSRGGRRPRCVDRRELQPDAVDAARPHGARGAGLRRRVRQRSRGAVGSREQGRRQAGRNRRQPPGHRGRLRRADRGTSNEPESRDQSPAKRDAERRAQGSDNPRPNQPDTRILARLPDFVRMHSPLDRPRPKPRSKPAERTTPTSAAAETT